VISGHSIEFRINGEDPGRGFLPAPGALTRFDLPAGPGVRVDTGFKAGDVIGGAFDSLLAKLIVTGRDRREALERSRRALAEFTVDGIATALTFHRVVVSDPAFTGEPFAVHTRWIETEFDNQIPAYDGSAAADEPAERQTVVVEVGGRRLEVTLPAGSLGGSLGGAAGTGGATGGKAARRTVTKAKAGASGDAVVAPMQGTIVKVAVAEGDTVAAGDLVVVLEAMKMEQPLTAHKAGVVHSITAEVGTTVPTGTELLQIKD
jgi:acetyl-CoA/propionyl-CoA carboxylase biotin carboxyl carrier protein